MSHSKTVSDTPTRVYWSLAQGRRPAGWMLDYGGQEAPLGREYPIDDRDPTLMDDELREAAAVAVRNIDGGDLDPAEVSVDRARCPSLERVRIMNAGTLTTSNGQGKTATVDIVRSNDHTAVVIRDVGAPLLNLRMKRDQAEALAAAILGKFD